MYRELDGAPPPESAPRKKSPYSAAIATQIGEALGVRWRYRSAHIGDFRLESPYGRMRDKLLYRVIFLF